MERSMKKILGLIYLFTLATIVAYAQIPTNGLVAYYPFNGNANDESGNGNNGTLVGATMTSDRFGVPNKACLINGNTGFYGSGIFVSIPNSVQGLSQVTLSIWVREYNLTYYHGEAYISFGAHQSGLLSIGHFNSANPSGNISFDVSNPPNGLGIGYPYDDSFTNIYEHYVLVYDGVAGTLKAYQNGNLIETQTGMTGAIVTPVDFGGIGKHLWDNGSQSSTRFNGEVDDVRIYNRALSEAEIGALYHEGGWNANSSITITSPNGGEVWYKGTPYTIQWRSTNYTGNVQIHLYKGGTLFWVLDGNRQNNGTLSFTPPCDLPNGTDYKIVVAAFGTGTPNDFSDANFSIRTSPINDPCNEITKFKLRFPLEGTAYSYPINAVFDHSNPNSPSVFCPPNRKVIDCWGDSGTIPFGQSLNTNCDLYGYTKPIGEQPRKFTGFRFYKGETVLYYDNHPGYDYKTGFDKIVTASARGKVIYPKANKPFPGVANGESFNVIGILHMDYNDQFNGYISYFIHNKTYEGDLAMPAAGDTIEKGDYVGQTGSKGTKGPHLHYELHYTTQQINLEDPDLKSARPVDPYGWRNSSLIDPYQYHQNISGGRAINLWEERQQPYNYIASLITSSSTGKMMSVTNVGDTIGIFLEWIFDACSDSLSHFEIMRQKSDGTTLTFTSPANGCPYYNYIDNSIEPNETYTYYVRVAFLNGTFSGASTPSVISTNISSVSTQTLYAFQNYTVLFSVDSSGLYQLNLSQPRQQVQYLSSKTNFTSKVDSIGFFIHWELIDPSGLRVDNSSHIVGNIVYTDTSQTFVLSTRENQTGIWNLILSGTENIPIGDSLVVTSQITSTSQSVYKTDREVFPFFNVPLGEIVSDSIEITNIGNTPLEISWNYFGSEKFQVSSDSSVIPPMQQYRIPVIFLSLDTSYVTGEIILQHNGITSPDTVLLIGKGGISAPTIPELISPLNESIDQPTTLTLLWEFLDNADKYHLQVAVDSHFTQIIFEDSTIVENSKQLENLANNTIHYWRVRAMNAGGTSDWSETWNFNTIIVSVNDIADLPKEYALEQNYPNPFNPITIIRYQLPTNSRVTLKIYNVLGQEVKTLADEIQEAGYKSIEWNSTNNFGSTVASGMYFYRLQTHDPSPDKSGSGHRFVETKKLVLVR